MKNMITSQEIISTPVMALAQTAESEGMLALMAATTSKSPGCVCAPGPVAAALAVVGAPATAGAVSGAAVTRLRGAAGAVDAEALGETKLWRKLFTKWLM